jgi:hypothetical protein
MYFQTETSALVLPKEGDPWARLLVVSGLTFEGFFLSEPSGPAKNKKTFKKRTQLSWVFL